MIAKEDEQLIDAMVWWIKGYADSAGATSLVVGVSGGVDSAVIAKLCEKTGLNLICITMPAKHYEQDLPSYNRARKQCVKINCSFLTFSIAHILDTYSLSFVAQTSAMTKLRKGNLAARIRTNVLYDFAAANNGLVVGTCNCDEWEIGYFTKGGDGLADMEPLVQMHKSQVYELAERLGVDREIIDAEPSAELWDGQTDKGELGFDYDQVEKVIESHYDSRIREDVPDDVVKKIKDIMINTYHKRHTAQYFSYEDYLIAENRGEIEGLIS